MPAVLWGLGGLMLGLSFSLGAWRAGMTSALGSSESHWPFPTAHAARMARERQEQRLRERRESIPRPSTADVVEELLRKEQLFLMESDQLQDLFLAAWGAAKPNYFSVLRRSFTWVTYRCNDRLTGFANVAWDGGSHFFLLDVTVHPAWRGRGIARRLVQEAIELCRGKGEWLHVDAESVELMKGLYEPCGFGMSPAGVIDLRVPPVNPLGAG